MRGICSPHRDSTGADDLRETDLVLRADAEAAKGNTTKETIIREILERERKSDIFRLLRYWVGGKSYEPMDEILVPDDPGDIDNYSWTSLVEATAIWEALQTNAVKHFTQASDTPFVTGPISERIGPFEYNETSESILNGTYPIEEITNNLEVIDLVKVMSRPNSAVPVEDQGSLSLEQLRKGFLSLKEGTSSSPEGLHHGHWKTLAADEEAFKPFGYMIMFASRWTEIPTAWQTAVQVILGKDPGEHTKMTRIRRIQLVSAAMNMGFRMIWGHEMMKTARRLGLLSEVQFGAINGRMCISAVLLSQETLLRHYTTNENGRGRL